MRKGFLSLLGILLTFVILIFLIMTVLDRISARNQSGITNNPKQIEDEARKNIDQIQQKSRQNQSIEVQ